MRAFFWFTTVTEDVQAFLLFLTNNASKLFKGEYYQPSKGGAVHAHAHPQVPPQWRAKQAFVR